MKIFPALLEFKSLFLVPKNLIIQNYLAQDEGIEYSACQFDLNSEKIQFRLAKITPTKIGQFVTFWKRNHDAITAPYDVTDLFDSLIVYTKTPAAQGFFLFPKNVLLKHGIVSQDGKGGKRGFRVYPVWDTAENAQAKKTQAWQLKYFTKLHKTVL